MSNTGIGQTVDAKLGRTGKIIVAAILTLFRVWLGYTWGKELLWKYPWLGDGGFGCSADRFNLKPGEQAGGLCDWMQREADHPAFSLYGDFVRNVVIPNFTLFAWMSVMTESLIAVMLIFGIFTRLGALISVGWSISLLIGLIGVPGEDLITYLVFIIPGIIFVILGASRQFSVDALLAHSYERWGAHNKTLGRLFTWLAGSSPGSAGVL